MLVSSCKVNAAGEAPELPLSPRAQIALAAMIPVVASWIMLYGRKSEKEFTSRFNSKKVSQVSKFYTKDYLANLWYGFYDEIIGQRKQSSALKMKEDKKIYPSEETPAYGVLGNVDAYLAPFGEAASKFTAPVLAAVLLWNNLKKAAHTAAKQSERIVPVAVSEAFNLNSK